MRAIVRRWGNSLGIRLPKPLAAAANLRDGDEVTFDLEADAIRIRRAVPRYSLDELLSKITPDSTHPEIDTGPPMGNEEW